MQFPNYFNRILALEALKLNNVTNFGKQTVYFHSLYESARLANVEFNENNCKLFKNGEICLWPLTSDEAPEILRKMDYCTKLEKLKIVLGENNYQHHSFFQS